MTSEERALRADALRGLLTQLTAEGLTLEAGRKVRAQMNLLMDSRVGEPASTAAPLSQGPITADDLQGVPCRQQYGTAGNRLRSA